MNEEEIVNRFLNMIATEYNGDLANQFKNQYILKEKEIERLNKENTILRQNSQYLVKQKDELEEVINKAIEYIENYLCSDEYIQSDINSIANAFVKLVDILKGVDKE